jgi:thiamine-monophosphate kinase
VSQGPGLPDEFRLIARYFAPLARGFPGAYELLDDAAVIAPAPGHELVVKTDGIIAGTHFLPEDPPDLVARKALRVNLSDLAAKGAVPRAYMLDLMLPATVTEAWIAAFASGLALDQDEYGVHLIGGDTDATPGPISAAITAFGEVPAGCIVRRGGAHAGDTLFVTGTIGDAIFGLEALRGNLPELDAEQAAFLADRYRLPRPRVTVGPRLIGLATAAADISDGLVADLRHICDVSGLSAVVEGHRVPLSPAARAAAAIGKDGLSAALTSGDDYEILFTAPPGSEGDVVELSRSLGIPITPIGRMSRCSEADTTVAVLDTDGRPIALGREGWTHFGRSRLREASSGGHARINQS